MKRALALCLLLSVGSARADDAPPTLDQRVLALRSESAESRRASLLALLETDSASLDAVQAYVRGLGKPTGLLEKLALIRADDAKDLPSALLHALDRDRSPAMVQAVALSALLRALERQHSIEASALIVSELFAVSPVVFRGEAPRTRKRLGKLLAPGWIKARASEDPALQKLAKDGLRALGFSTPQRL
ncbi:MAG TPA: hypothetical protein VFX59_15785, partial [Polyangiales bacterium]|nr:hypothetical protein [Polyangiales bacterium]